MGVNWIFILWLMITEVCIVMGFINIALMGMAKSTFELGDMILSAAPVGKLWRSVFGPHQSQRRMNQARDDRSFLKKIIDINPCLIYAKDREGRYTLA